MKKILLITPPLLQPNAPYPATAYLAGWLSGQGYGAAQADLSVELLGEIFSSEFLREAFAAYAGGGDDNVARIHALGEIYVSTVDAVMDFMRGQAPELADVICRPGFLPQARSFDAVDSLEDSFGELGTQDCARHLSTLYLHDISSYLRVVVSPLFEISRYGESLAVSVPDFAAVEAQLVRPANMIERRMTALLDKHITRQMPEVVAFTVPFPGNLLAALRCSRHIKDNYPGVVTVIGGGYPSTELRSMSDRTVFQYVDYVVLDGGEQALRAILEGGRPAGTYDASGFNSGCPAENHADAPCPDFSGLPHELYFSLCERTNPMHRLWSDGRWNKMVLAHGCYWARCSFCDTSLDYIKRYQAMPVSRIVDYMERVAGQSGSRGFHFVDEAAPPKILKELSLELLRRGLRYTWWTNVRFESGFTADLCRLMADAGCIAVSGGVEAASDRLLTLIDKGVSVEQATIAMRNFFYAGVMVHGYLMYGLPGQTLQECVDSLEVVRQMFRARLLDSAFWHRYAMTVHSPMGADPSRWGVRRRNEHVNAFANNEVAFVENRGYDIHMVGDALRTALDNYLAGQGLERPAHKWFAGKAPVTTVEEGLIAAHLIKPDSSRLLDPDARMVWLAPQPVRNQEGVTVITASDSRQIKLSDQETAFLTEVLPLAARLGDKFTFGQARDIYATYSDQPFVQFYLSKKWDRLREAGLLQI